MKTKNYDKIGEFQFLPDNKAKCSFLFKDSYLEEIPPIQVELKEKESEKKETVPEHIVETKHRILSAVLLWHGIPIDYRDQAMLEKAASLVIDKPLFKDHITLIDYNIGKIKDSVFDKSTTPTGINANFWIDRRLDEKTAIRVECGYLKCCSITVKFQWKKSHPKMSDKEFMSKLGQTISGQLVRLIVTKIIEIPEVSVVWLGADRTARALSEMQTNQNKNIENPVQQQDKEVKTIMDEETKKLLSQLSGKGIETLSTDAGIQAALDALNEKVQTLETDKTSLNQQVDSLQEWKSGVMEGLKSDVECKMKLVDGIEEDGQKILPTMNKAALENADYNTLVEMNKEYEAKKTKMFPPTCPECKTKITEFRSSVDSELPGDTPRTKKPRQKITYGGDT